MIRRAAMTLLAALTLSCTPRVVTNPAMRVTDLGWCVPAQVTFNGKAHSGLVCTDERALCERVREVAQQVGGVAGVVAIGVCAWEGS